MGRVAAEQVTWVGVLDGAKALLFEDRGFADAPDLHLLEKDGYETAPDRALGRDAPGRMTDPGPGHKSALQQTDRQALKEDRFVADFADMLNAAALAGRYDRLVLLAPPRAMGVLREQLHEEAARRIARTLTGDYVNHPTPKLETLLKRAAAAPAAFAE